MPYSAFVNRPYFDPLYPTGAGENRDERMLIEYQGIMHSEAEEIMWGMISCDMLHQYPFKKYSEIMNAHRNDPTEVYAETAFFRPDDLITYLNDGEKLPEFVVNYIKQFCKVNYTFVPSTLIAFAGAMKRLMEEDYIESVTFAFDSPYILKDKRYLEDILSPELLQTKGRIILPEEDNPVDVRTLMSLEILRAKAEGKPYTTVVTNSIQLIYDCVTHLDQTGANEMFFLLRNNSENMIMKEDGTFEELGTQEIVDILNPNKDREDENGLHLPLPTKFARFAPIPFRK